MSLLLASTFMLTPVAIDDPSLKRGDTFASTAALSAMAETDVARIHCLELPENHPDGSRASLTQAEWQAVFDRVAQQQSADRRERQIVRSQRNASMHH